MYASLAEAAYAKELDLLVAAGKVKSWLAQVPHDLYAYDFFCDGPRAYRRVAAYRGDFLVTLPDGAEELHEVKARHGYRDPLWKLKLKWLKACYPWLTVRVVER